MLTASLLAGTLAGGLAGAPMALAPPPSDPDPFATQSAEDLRRTKRPDDQFTFYGYFLTRAELTNVSPENDLFKGQVVGRLFGPNTTRTSDKRAVFLEQRFIPFFIYEPDLLNNKARLRTSFEIDWTFGDTSNATGGNFGSSFTADQVNLQTQNLAVEIDLWKGWYVNIGLQRLYDTALDPYRTPFGQMQLTGPRMAFWGSDAVGLTLHGNQWGQKFKLGAYQLYENLIQEDDDVALFELATDRHIKKTWHVGGHVRYLRDSSAGQGGVGLLGQGPNSTLAEYTGAFRFTIPDDAETYRSHLVWAGLDTSYNPLFNAGRVAASAFAVGNFGQVVTSIPGQSGDFQKLTNIVGLAANARVGYKYGRTPRDHIVAEVMYTTGDSNGLEDGTYNGVVTGNTWGAPGAVYTSHGAYLLLPHGNVVNRFYAAVPDISNLGFGVTAATVNASYDILRNLLAVKLGGAVGRSNVQPVGGGNFIGAELNANISWRIRPLLNLEAHGAYLWLGDYFESPEIADTNGRPQNPWTAFLTLKWLMI